MDLPKFLRNFTDLLRLGRFTRLWLTAVFLLLFACTTATDLPATPVATELPIPTSSPPAVTGTSLAAPFPTQLSATQLPSPTAGAAEADTAVPPPSTAAPTAVHTPAPTDFVNGVPVDQIVILPPETAVHIREIFARGQEYGRNPHAFSKLGDSAVLISSYLTRFDDPARYTLGEWSFLQPTIDYYAGSFQRYGVATRVGLSSWGVMDPTWANKEFCNPNEVMLACEVRLFNPSIILIHLGTNDVRDDGTFNRNMRDILDYCLEQGIIPILATKADRFEGEGNRNNQILADLAAEYKVPLWDFDAVAATLPDHGLDEDQIHLTAAAKNDYTDPEIWNSGYPVSDLTALLMLNAVRQTLEKSQP